MDSRILSDPDFLEIDRLENMMMVGCSITDVIIPIIPGRV
jgi:hypothetical protein